MDSSIGSTFQWGYTRAFRAVVAHPRPRCEDPGKWISFLPSAMLQSRRLEVFDALALEVLTHPHLRTSCYQGKMALHPLPLYPHRIALMFYCDGPSQDVVFEHLKPVARAHRRALLKSGELSTKDAFLGRWEYKSDMQTTQELAAGTHDAQVSLMMALWGDSAASPPRAGRLRR